MGEKYEDNTRRNLFLFGVLIVGCFLYLLNVTNKSYKMIHKSWDQLREVNDHMQDMLKQHQNALDGLSSRIGNIEKARIIEDAQDKTPFNDEYWQKEQERRKHLSTTKTSGKFQGGGVIAALAKIEGNPKPSHTAVHDAFGSQHPADGDGTR